jgi:hypothetical protein
MAALLPFRKVDDFLGELLPLSAQAAASTMRNRTMKVGRRLQKSAEVLAAATSKEPCKELVVGFDGGYVRNRHQRPERNFEVVAGKALDRDGHATRCAFVRNSAFDSAWTLPGYSLEHKFPAGVPQEQILDGPPKIRRISTKRHMFLDLFADSIWLIYLALKLQHYEMVHRFGQWRSP